MSLTDPPAELAEESEADDAEIAFAAAGWSAQGCYGAVLWHDLGGPSSQSQPHLVQPANESPSATAQASTHIRLIMPDPLPANGSYNKAALAASRRPTRCRIRVVRSPA